MKRIFTIVTVFMAVSVAVPFSGAAQESKFNDSYIEVNGSAEQEVAPDLFYLRVDIDEQDSKGRKTLEQQQRDMLNALKTLGVDLEKQVVRLSLASSYYNRKSNMAHSAYRIKLTSAEQLSKVWNRLDELGLSEVSFQKAECSTITKVQDEVRQLAVRNAREQAASMAAAIGQTIGKCFYIYGGYNDTPAVYSQPRRLTKTMSLDSVNMAEEAEAESLEFDNIKITARVTARFVLE
ncbi:MAG: SIMPL domain-containing protein [Bacteroidales bacterium]|nr:SIMPL domain-containing protein [Bacteroidales bacterium]